MFQLNSSPFLGRAIARLEVQFNSSGKAVAWKSATDVIDSSIVPDTSMEKLLEKYAKEMAPKLAAHIGQCRTKDLSYHNHKSVGYPHSPLGLFISKVLRSSFNPPADIGIVNCGAIRDGIEQGEVTWGTLNEVWPFKDELMKVRIPGSLVKQMVYNNAVKMNRRERGLVRNRISVRFRVRSFIVILGVLFYGFECRV